jgi:hypothetical protein
MNEERARVGIEVTLEREPSLDLDDEPVIQVRIALGEVTIETLAGGKYGDSPPAGPVDVAVAQADGTGLAEAYASLT